MNRLIVGGILALVTGLSGLMAQKAPQPKSQKEVEALMAVQNAQDADTRIKAAENVLEQFADTEFKPMLLIMLADAYRSKGDWAKEIVYGERTLEADPNNYQAMIMLAEATAQHTGEHDLDKAEKLAKANKYANSALETLKTATKPRPDLPDEQWESAKKDLMAEAHQALGIAALVDKKYPVAISEFKAAIDNASQPDPAAMVRLANAYDQAGKPDEALPILEKVMAMPNLHPSIRQFAQAERVRAMQAKGGGAKPAAPATGGAVSQPAAPASPAPGSPAPAPPTPKQ